MGAPSPSTARKTALIIAHPGHELRVHRWLELVQPTVFVLTDGGGRTHRSRMASTTRVLERAGATPAGRIYGYCSDAAVYAAVLAGDIAWLTAVTRALVDALIALDADTLVADALEGFNPSHDICRYIVNLATAQLRERTGRDVKSYDFLLDGNPEQCPPHLRDAAVKIVLSEQDLARKLAAAEGYPELKDEMERALARYGTRPFSTEYLRPVVDPRQGLDALEEDPPYYERFGEQRVAAGHYREVIRYRQHVRPLIHALWQEAGLALDAGAASRP